LQAALPHQPTYSAQIRFLLGDRRAYVVALVIASVLSGIAESAVLTVVAQAAAALVSGNHRVRTDLGIAHTDETVGTALALALVLAVVRLFLQAPVSMLPARIAANVQGHLRENLFEAFTSASWATQAKDREGYLQELMTNQVIYASQGAFQATALVTASLTLAILVLSALVLDPLAAAVVLGAAIVLFLGMRPLSKLGNQQSFALSRAQMNYASGIGEATRLAEETHVFGVADAYRSSMRELVAAAQHLFFRTQMIGRLVPNVYQSFIYLIVVVGLIALNATHTGHVGSLGAVVLLLVRAGTYGQQVQGAYGFTGQALPYVERLRQAEARYSESAPLTGHERLDTVDTIAFDDVTFAYVPGRPVLSGITFELAGGEAIGVVGPSGAGKSTLVQLMLRLRVADSGRYLINGSPANAFTTADWHRVVAYVPQVPHLLHASVAANISYFRDLPPAAVEQAAKLARIHDDVMTWEHGYNTIIGPRADAISGGQQQRICIARALAAQPEVLVLDEPTSALDPQSERRLQESLVALKAEVTLIVIAHRMSTLEICGRVMVIIDGQIEAFDTIARLRQQSPYFASAWSLSADRSGQAPPP
jgi:ABC-type multidrug transport system fused ATPase/permease subunit